MKHFFILISVLLWLPSSALAQEPVELSRQAKESVQQQVREMSALGIPQDQARTMLTQMVRQQFRQHSITQAREVVMNAAKAGLPTEAVMSKAMEGMAKQVNEQQIVAAMDQVRSRHAYGHQKARELNAAKKTANKLAGTIADGLAAGMTTRDMDKVMAQLQDRNRVDADARREKLSLQTMMAVRTMARMGVTSKEVSDTLCQAIQNRYSWQEMKSLRTQMAKKSHLSSPQQVAHQHAGAIGKGGKGSDAGQGSEGGPGGGSSGNDGGNSGGSGEGGGSGGSGGSGGGGGNGGGSGGGGNGGGNQ